MERAAEMIPFARRYLGIPYDQMDCQAFVETCLRDIGIRINLPGSNAWYRKMNWIGSPEACKKTFGSIPKGAFLFILDQDGKEPDKYKADGVGNASHIGLYTGEGKGAIHSSSSRGCVCESEFHGKTIRNGGWNRIGLWTEKLLYDGISEMGRNDEDKKEMIQLTAIVTAETGSSVKMRDKPSESCPYYENVPIGAEVNIISSEGNWSRIEYNGRTGFMKNEFLTEKSSDPGSGGSPLEMVQISITMDQARDFLRQLVEMGVRYE